MLISCFALSIFVYLYDFSDEVTEFKFDQELVVFGVNDFDPVCEPLWLCTCEVSGGNPYMTWPSPPPRTDTVMVERTFTNPSNNKKVFFTTNDDFLDSEVDAELCESFLCDIVYDIYNYENGFSGDRINTCLYEGDLNF